VGIVIPLMHVNMHCRAIDNAVAESFFHLLKRERIRRLMYLRRAAAKQDLIDYIEMFHNPNRKHTNNGILSPVDCEKKQQKLNKTGIWEAWGTSGLRQNPT